MHWDEIATWPNADLSRQVPGPVHKWHVQDAGRGPLILMLHGAGGSSHSLRDLIAPLAETHRVIALDLPGHGFTQLGARHRSGLQAMTDDIAALARQEGWAPVAILGHSAGAAVALNLSKTLLSPRGQPPKIIGVNAALGEFEGLAGLLFPLMAKLLSVLPFTAALFSGTSASPARVQSLIQSTGSTLTPDGMALYRRLVGDRDHVDGTLLMMAQWDLKPLLRDLGNITAQTTFIVGTNDRTVPAGTSHNAAQKMPNAEVIELKDFGHLVHEEVPGQVVTILRNLLRSEAG